MPAAQRPALPRLLAPLVLAALVLAPCAQAKKDLFGSEPGAKQAHALEQLAPTAPAPTKAAAPSDNAEHPTSSAESSKATTAATNTSAAATETQLARFKRHLNQTKQTLFGEATGKSALAAPADEPQPSATAAEPNLPAPSISPTEAAQRAQSLAEGQVINVRHYQESSQEGEQARYAVKLLQKNGRMKTINLDAVTGAPIEEKPVEDKPAEEKPIAETPQ